MAEIPIISLRDQKIAKNVLVRISVYNENRKSKGNIKNLTHNSNNL